MTAERAVFRATRTTVQRAIEAAALEAEGNESRTEIFIRATADGLETPASGIGASQLSYCTLKASLFDEITVIDPVAALIPVRTVLEWLSWFDDAEPLTISFVGEGGAEMATELRIADSRRSVTIDCVDDATILEEIETWLPDRFDGPTFLGATGEPVPTRVETTTAELERIVGAVQRTESVEQYPVRVADGEVAFEVAGAGARSAGVLDATVEGPGFEARYGPGFARIVRALEGDVTLSTGPDEPLAIVSTKPGLTLRHLVRPA